MQKRVLQKGSYCRKVITNFRGNKKVTLAYFYSLFEVSLLLYRPIFSVLKGAEYKNIASVTRGTVTTLNKMNAE